MEKVSRQSLTFDDFTLDLTRGCLLRGTGEVKLRPKSFQVLRHLVENSARLVSKAELMEAAWPDSFVTDDSLVQCLIEVRRALEDNARRYIKTVPRRGYVFDAQVTEEGDGVSFVVGEGLEEGRKTAAPSAAAERDGERSPSRAAALALMCAVLVLAACVLISYRRRVDAGEGRAAPLSSVAVLPLKNLSDDPAQEYFSDGLTESLINALSKIEGLKVISRGSVFSLKGRDVDPREAGRRLGVATVLEGSVRKDADSVRVAVRLVSADDGRVLWASDSQEHALGDIFALQDEIARGMAAGLRVRLTGESERQLGRRYTDDLEAYQLYMQGRFFWNKRTEAGMQKSIEFFERAIARDPNYALAYAGLADSYALLNLYGSVQQRDAPERSKAAAERALQLDDTLAEAHNALAYIKEQYEWDWPGAEREFRRALELNPNYATAHQYYGEYLAFVGRTDESVWHLNRAHELDPFSLIIKTARGYPYLAARRCGEALEKFREALEMDPDFPLATFYVARCYEQEGKYAEAVEEYRKAIVASGGSSLTTAGLGHAYAVAGKRAAARKVLGELMELSRRRYVSPYLIATMHAGLGEKDRAFAWLERAYADRDYLMVVLRVDSRFTPLRGDARFANLLRRIGHDPEGLTSP